MRSVFTCVLQMCRAKVGHSFCSPVCTIPAPWSGSEIRFFLDGGYTETLRLLWPRLKTTTISGASTMADSSVEDALLDDPRHLILHSIPLSHTSPTLQELTGLKGWRLGVSFFLEALDALEPFLKSLLHRIGDILSFILVTFIGRSLGLILKGVQSSIQIPWGKANKP